MFLKVSYIVLNIWLVFVFSWANWVQFITLIFLFVLKLFKEAYSTTENSTQRYLFLSQLHVFVCWHLYFWYTNGLCTFMFSSLYFLLLLHLLSIAIRSKIPSQHLLLFWCWLRIFILIIMVVEEGSGDFIDGLSWGDWNHLSFLNRNLVKIVFPLPGI